MDNNWIVILVFLAIGFLNWLFGENGLRKMIAKDREDVRRNTQPPTRPPMPESRQSPPPIRPAATPTSPVGRTVEEQKVRDFLEALGLPADAKPPASPAPRPYPPRQERPVAPKPVVVPAPVQSNRPQPRPSVSPPMTGVRPAVAVAREPAPVLAPAAAAAVVEREHAAYSLAPSPDRRRATESRDELIRRLKNPRGVRDAFVLAEVLGRPVCDRN